MRNLEDALQESCVKWFRLQYNKRIIFAIPNGGKRSIATAVRLKKTGVLAGVPDLFIPEVDFLGLYHGFFVELKVGKNKPTDAQKEILTALEVRGYKVQVINSFHDFVDAMNVYFGGIK